MLSPQLLLETDKEILRLKILKAKNPSGLTAEEQIKLDKLESEKSQSNLLLPSVANTTTAEAPSLVTALDSIKTAELPSGTMSVQYITCDTLNLAEYMEYTQNLNPWKRDRPCDSDLRDLLLIIDNELSGEYKKLLKGIKALTKLGNNK